MPPTAECQLIGRWRIIEPDLSNQDYLDLSRPPSVFIHDQGNGEIWCGFVRAGLEFDYSRTIVFFTFQGFQGWGEDLTEVTGSGSAELLDDGSLKIEISVANGGDAILKAEPWPS